MTFFTSRFRRQYLDNRSRSEQRRRTRQKVRAAAIVLSAVLLYCAIVAGYSGSKIRVAVYLVDSGCTFMSEGEE